MASEHVVHLSVLIGSLIRFLPQCSPALHLVLSWRLNTWDKSDCSLLSMRKPFSSIELIWYCRFCVCRYSPNIKEIKVVDKRKVRRAKLYYLRDKIARLSSCWDSMSSEITFSLIVAQCRVFFDVPKTSPISGWQHIYTRYYAKGTMPDHHLHHPWLTEPSLIRIA